MFNHIPLELPKLQRVTNSDGSRVYATPSGKKYPSVTTVTGLLKKDIINEWRKRVGDEEANKISSKAAKRGTRIHTLCEKYLLNEEVSVQLFDAEMWNSMRPLLDDIDDIYALEQPLYSDHLQVAGTVDCIARYKGKLSVIDFKSSKRIKHRDDIHDYFIQCSAYAVAFEELTGIPVPRLVILMAVDDEKPLVFNEKRNDWIEEFKTLRLEYKRQKGI
jgi:ATP-dependent exoDNAse (exonuclease V) beta subunit